MPDPAREDCTNCHYCHANDAKQPECWHDPPAVIGEAIFSASPMAGGPPRVNWIVNAVRPVVRPGWTCASFTPRAQIVN